MIEIAKALDIVEVNVTHLDGCEGILLTDMVRSHGSIVVNDSRGQRRARFSIAHELGHFLMERHVLSTEVGFRCLGTDMREGRGDTRGRRQEAEANRFAANLLAPSYLVRRHLEAEPSIEVMLEMRNALDISLEAAGRILVERHDEPLAMVCFHDGRIRYIVRGNRFPWIDRQIGDAVSAESQTAKVCSTGRQCLTNMVDVAPSCWTGTDIPELFEQVRIGRGGHGLTLLSATLGAVPDDD